MRVRPAIALIVALTVVPLAVFLTLFAGPLATPGWAESPTWTDLGGPYVGPAQALAISPNYPTDPIVLAGGNRDFGRASWSGNGLFRSLDGGLTWPNRFGPANGPVFDVAFSPDWSGDHFAAAGFFPGLWSTSDGGASWQQLPSWPDDVNGPFGVSVVAIGPATGISRTLLVASMYGAVSRTTDYGANWTSPEVPYGMRGIAFDPVAPNTVLAAGNGGLWRSIDAGVTWTNVMSATAALDVAFQPGHGAAYATVNDRIWRSDDGGTSWAPFTSLKAAYVGEIGVSADGSGLFVAGQNALYRYEAASTSFVTVTTNLRVTSTTRLAPSPKFAADQTLLAGTDEGVWISHDRGSTFVRSEGFVALPVQNMAAAPDYATGGDLFAGGEYGIWRRSNGQWDPANNGLYGTLSSMITGIAVSPAYTQDHTVFASQTTLVSIGSQLFKSVDRGASWRAVNSAGSIGPIVLSPGFGADKRAYLRVDSRVQTSVDGGESWTVQPFWSDTDAARLLAISPNFVTNHTLYVVGSNAYYSKDAGATWHKAANPPPLLDSSVPRWTPAHLVVASDDTLFLSIYVYTTNAPYDRHDQLWSSTDGGNTWSRIAGAPDFPVTDLVVDGNAAGSHALYLSTYDDDAADDVVIPPDIYRSLDGGSSWQNLGAAPTHAESSTLVVPSSAANTLLVGSKGVWSLALGDAPTATPDPCQEVLLNGSFEQAGVWRIPETAYKAARTTDKHSQGAYSMRTGITMVAENKRSYSDFSQDVAIPNLPEVTLHFQRWPQSGAPAASIASSALQEILGAATLDAFYQRLQTFAGDFQYAMVIELPSGAIHFLYARLDNQQAWVNQQFDLSAYKGQTVRLQFGTFNDGIGAVAAAYFDVMSLQACSAPVATATPALTATPTATMTYDNHAWLPAIRYSKDNPWPTEQASGN